MILMSILLDIGQRRIQNCIKKVKAETFIKAFDHLNDKIHYAAEHGLSALNDKKF